MPIFSGFLVQIWRKNLVSNTCKIREPKTNRSKAEPIKYKYK